MVGRSAALEVLFFNSHDVIDVALVPEGSDAPGNLFATDSIVSSVTIASSNSGHYSKVGASSNLTMQMLGHLLLRASPTIPSESPSVPLSIMKLSYSQSPA